MNIMRLMMLTMLLLLPPLAQADIKFSWSVNAGPLNPHQTTPNQMYAQAMVYESLVRYAEGGKIIPWLAKHWEISEDGVRYRFFLRQDVKFSNGEKFNAQAVKLNLEQVIANIEKHRWLELINQIDHLDVIDEFTLDLHLKSPYYPTLQELTLVRPVRFMAPSAMPDKGHTGQGIKAPIGTGPWVLAESVLGVKDVFKQNPHYWGKKPGAEQVEVAVIADPNARVLAFESGMINLIYGLEGQISPDSFARLSKQKDLQTDLSQPLLTRLIAMNTAQSATKERAVRLAINHTIDRKAIAEGIFYGIETPAHTIFPENVPYANIGLGEYKRDLDYARKLLQDSGWKDSGSNTYRKKDGQPLKVELVYHGHDANQKAIAEVLQANLKEIGIELVLAAEERSRFYRRQKAGEFDLIFNNTWGVPYDPHAFVSGMRRPSHADYMAQAGLAMKASIDANINAVLTSTDETRRKELYRDVLSTLHEQAVYLPISYMRVSAVASAQLGNLEIGSTVFDIPFERLNPQ